MSLNPRHLALLASLALSACGGSLVISEDDGATRVPTPTVSRADVRAFDAQVDDLQFAQRTSLSQLPTGTVTYEGQVGSNVSIAGQGGYGLLGDMRMNVSFSGFRDVTGTVRNINLLENGTPVQVLGGQLAIDGTQFAGRIEADADGVLSLVDANGRRLRTNMALDLDGRVVNDVFVGDAVTGGVTGFGDGFQLSGDTVNILLDGGGSFVGTVN